MSVRAPDRKPGKLDVNTKAKGFCKHTLTITSNRNVFYKGYDDVLTQIRQAAIDIHKYCWIANNIRVDNNVDRYYRRIELQARAVDTCVALGALIDLAKGLWHLSGSKVKYWNDLLVDLRKNISAWHSSDVQRLKPKA